MNSEEPTSVNFKNTTFISLPRRTLILAMPGSSARISQERVEKRR